MGNPVANGAGILTTDGFSKEAGRPKTARRFIVGLSRSKSLQVPEGRKKTPEHNTGFCRPRRDSFWLRLPPHR